MAYQIKRNKAVTEELELVDENGEVVKTILVRLDRAGVIQDINKKVIELSHIESAVNTASFARDANDANEELTKTLKSLENAFLSLSRIIFGDTDTQTIIDFYGGNVFEMSNEITPFLMQAVIPKIREIARETKRNKLRSYDRKRFFVR